MKNLSFNLKNKNILITGGAGFLGSQIAMLFQTKIKCLCFRYKKPAEDWSNYFKTDITKEKELLRFYFY